MEKAGDTKPRSEWVAPIPQATHRLTPDMVPFSGLEQDQIDEIVRRTPDGAANISDIYSLTSLQERILFRSILNEERGDAYVIQTMLSLPSRESVDRLLRALQDQVERHDALRTSPVWDLPRTVQVVYRSAAVSVETLELKAGRAVLTQLEEHMRPERQRMDLRRPPLVQVQIAEDTANEKWYAILKVHHLICDRESLRRLVSELMTQLEGRMHELPQPLPYRVHVLRALQPSDLSEARTFFSQKLSSIGEPIALFGMLQEREDPSELRESRMRVNGSVGQRIRAEAGRRNLTAEALFHSAWALVVSQCTGREEIVYGIVTSGQEQETGITPVVGMTSNTLPLRLLLRGFSSEGFVTYVCQELSQLLRYRHISLAFAQSCAGLEGSVPLFNSLLEYRRYASAPANGNATGVRVVAERAWLSYPISVSIDELEDGFLLTAQTDSRLEPKRLLDYLHSAIDRLTQSLEQAPLTSLSLLSIMPSHERDYLLHNLNATGVVQLQKQTIHGTFERRTRAQPDAIAAICDHRYLSYAELNRQANKLAYHLHREGLAAGECVSIVMSRSLDLLIAQLAVLKAGGTFVPIDSLAPKERKVFIVKDCGARWVLADRAFEEALCLDRQRWLQFAPTSVWESCPSDDLEFPLSVQHPAYVMYTSGSTGTPKGVLVPHRAVTSLVLDTNYVRIDHSDRVVHCANPAFDASTFEVWGALLNGASLLIVLPEILLDSDRFAQVIEQDHATILLLTTAVFNQYATTRPEIFRKLRYMFFGGETADPNAVRKVMMEGRPDHLANVYGPTETTVFATWHSIECTPTESNFLPIGRPIADRQIYILDQNFKPVPRGVIGQICIGGQGTALGYLCRPALTAERFVADPFGTDLSGRLYQSGDLGVWREDGVIEYLGRNDQQIKLRGLRIELGEIESQLLRDPRVREAVAIVRDDKSGEKFIAAYVTPSPRKSASQSPVTSEDLRTLLKSALPDYMIPRAFVLIPSMPLTANGKVDRRALPEPELTSVGVGTRGNDEPPVGQYELELAEIWRELLRVDHIGRDSSFFELGGHSLLAMKLLVRIADRFGTRLSFTGILQQATLRAMALLTQGESSQCSAPAPPQELSLEDE